MVELAVPAAAILLLFPLWRRHRFGVFFLILLTTEFYYIQIGGGTARIYQFIAPLIAVSMIRHIPRLLRSKIFRWLFVFVAVNLLAIAWSDAPERAAASFLTVGANLCIAIATATILATGRVPIAHFRKLIIGVTVVSVAWGVMQVLLFRLVGVNAGLSESQAMQIQAGFGPAFRTEADTFGKFMIVPFMLYLPDYIERHRTKYMSAVYGVFAAGVLMNFTRSAIYGMAVVMPFVVWRYFRRRKGSLLLRRSVVLVAIGAAGVAVMIGGAVSQSEYAAYKIMNLFSRDEIVAGGSSSYRLEMTEALVNHTFSSTKRILIGNGWGQTWTEVRGVEVQAGGSDLLTVWAFAGVCAAMLYVIYMGVAFIVALRVASRASDPEMSIVAEGCTFAIGAVFVTGQMAGVMPTPEYWLLIGLAMFLEIVSQERKGVRAPRSYPAFPLKRNNPGRSFVAGARRARHARYTRVSRQQDLDMSQRVLER